MKITISTYDRWNRFETLLFLKKNNVPFEDVYIFLANEEEKQKYVNSFGNDYNWVVGVIGLPQQRNFITNYFDEGEIIISMDDDIEDLIHKNDVPFLDWIAECIKYLQNSNVGLLSISPSVNSFFFEQRKNTNSFKIGNYYAIGAFYICKNDKQIILSDDILLEDWERSLLYVKKYGGSIRFNDILIKTKYFGKGGLESHRNENNYSSSINKLIYQYSEYLSFNYKKLPLNKNVLFPNLKFNKQIKNEIDVIQLPQINPSELSLLYSMLENISLPKKNKSTNRRGFPIGQRSVTFGFTRGRYNGKYELSYYSKKYQEIYNELLRIGRIYCPLKFSTIHINKNVVCPPHKDSKNAGKSMLLSFGDYTGCNIVINQPKRSAAR